MVLSRVTRWVVTKLAAHDRAFGSSGDTRLTLKVVINELKYRYMHMR